MVGSSGGRYRDERSASGGGGYPPPPEEEEQQPPGDPDAVARAICLRMLEHRARSRGELASTLARRGVPDDAAQRVLDRYVEVGLIDDAGLAEALAGATHRERGLARRGVAAKLRQRGFDDDVINDAMSTIDTDDERTRAHQLVARRLRALAGLPVEVQVRRLVGLLARKGYPSGMSYEVVRAELERAATDVQLEIEPADC